MRSISTPFTRLMKINTPIVGAPMGFASTPELAARVTKAGGIGFVAAAFDTAQQIKNYVQTVREELGTPSNQPVQFGIGFIGWILDITEVSDKPCLPVFLEELPTAIWFAFGNDLGKYVRQVREYDSTREHKTRIFVMVHSVEQALVAHEWKVDVIVVQGPEAGGHGGSTATSLPTFLQAVLQAIPDGPPILAAGGITTGSQIAAMLTMGADGVVLGTRYLFTHECSYSSLHKEVLLSAGPNDTVRSDVFDQVHPPTPVPLAWPSYINGRCVINNVWKELEVGLPLEERKKNVIDGHARKDKDYLLVWAGEGAGLVNEIQGAAEVTCVLHEETLEALKRSERIIPDSS